MSDKKKLFDEIKLLYVKYCEGYQAWQRTREASSESNESESQLVDTTLESVKLNKLKKITEDFEQKAQELFSSAVRDTDDYKRFAIVLAYAWIAKLESMCRDSERNEECIELIKQLFNHLEPYKGDLMGIYPLMLTSAIYCLVYKRNETNLDTATKIASFVLQAGCSPKLGQVWNGPKLFEISVDKQSTDFIEYQKTHKMSILLTLIGEEAKDCIVSTSLKVKNDQKQIPKHLETISKMLKSGGLNQKLDAIFSLNEIAETCFNGFQFRQALHVLSVGMFNIVKIRRGLRVDKRVQLNDLQAELSNGYANYGYRLIMTSLDKKHRPDDSVLIWNSECIEITDLIEPGLEIYSSQFPTEYVDDYSEMKKIFKKVIAWNNRAIDLSTGNQEKINRFKAFKPIDFLKGLIILTKEQVLVL